MKSSSLLLRSLATALLFVSFASCSENLDSSGVCSVLCPPVGGNVQNLTLDAVVLDTAVPAFSGLGTEPGLLLASRGDTLDTRVVIRFDSLPKTFLPTGDTARPIRTVDSAYVQLMLDTLSIKGTGPFTIEAYDVDTPANDTSTMAILALFRPDRFISSQTFARTDLKDTVKYFISNAAVLAKIQSSAQLRIGLRATGTTSSSQFRFVSTEGGIAPLLRFRATPDTTTKPLTVLPFSRTPAGQSIVSVHLSDYTVVAKAPPPGAPSDLAVGGLPARRAYVRFDIPSSIVDSSTVVRATLLLNQVPNSAIDPTDTVRILPGFVLAGKAVKDPAKASQIVTDIALDTVFVKPGGSGLVQVELARAFTIWRTLSPDTTYRAIVLRSLKEGISPLEIRFSSTEAAPALRPRLRISYTPRVPLGLP
ncbi:MAG: hypothetical protein M3Z18_09755 [Gemmatimonadota bacterium]|nr:hypothetical protein [Gemmatimonadota bacterium]